MRLLILVLALGVLVACAQPAPRPSALRFEQPGLKQYLPQRPPDPSTLAPGMPLRQRALQIATDYLGTPYMWGGNDASGMDCSGYVTKALETARRETTDTLIDVTTMITKDELLPGDLLDLQTWEHPTKSGHVRIFAAWADDAHTKMWVFEDRYPAGAVYHVVTYDARYSALRYDPLLHETGKAAIIVPVQN